MTAKFISLFFVLLFSLFTFADMPQTAPFSKKVGELKSTLVKELQTALQSGGPELAIQVCSKRAYEISETMTKEGFEIGRTSHKIRNPKNAPRDWVKPYLEKFKGLTLEQIKAKNMQMNILVDLSNNKKGYLEPLFTQTMCLQCHGAKLDAKIESKIKSLYPNDQARGFIDGEFRGFVWIESTNK